MSIAMRMPAVSHRPVEVVVDRAREKNRRRSAWTRLGWTGVEALVFLGLLIVVALVPLAWAVGGGAGSWGTVLLLVAAGVAHWDFLATFAMVLLGTAALGLMASRASSLMRSCTTSSTAASSTTSWAGAASASAR